jgi:hypothetical protein
MENLLNEIFNMMQEKTSFDAKLLLGRGICRCQSSRTLLKPN